MKRDNLNKDQVQERIKNQLADIEKIRLSDMVIINNNEISLLSQIHYIHNKLTN
jgi:dephospho-CoA kinase